MYFFIRMNKYSNIIKILLLPTKLKLFVYLNKTYKNKIIGYKKSSTKISRTYNRNIKLYQNLDTIA